MFIIWLIVIISFFLDGLLSLYIPFSIMDISIFTPLFTVVSLVLIYNNLSKYENKYYKIIIVIGMLYDIVYSNTLIFNTIIFILLGFLISKFNTLLSDNLLNKIIMIIISIITYTIISYIVLSFIGYTVYNGNILFNKIINSIVLNVFYGILIYFIMMKVSSKKSIKYYR